MNARRPVVCELFVTLIRCTPFCSTRIVVPFASMRIVSLAENVRE